MSFKSKMLKIGLLIALIIMLIPVISAEDVNESVSMEIEQEDSISDVGDVSDTLADEQNSEGSDDSQSEDDDENGDDSKSLTDFEMITVPSQNEVESDADLQIVVHSNVEKAHVGDVVKFEISLYNLGSDTAENVMVRYSVVSGNLYLISTHVTRGVTDPLEGTWYLGDLEPGKYVYLYLYVRVLSNEEIIFRATVTSDSYDFIDDNNIALWYIDVESNENDDSIESSAFSTSEKMYDTGNPIALAMLALISAAGISLRRKL